MLISPDAAGIILGASDDGIAFVIERAGKDLVRMPLQLLQQLARFTVPQTSDLVETSCKDLGALRIKCHFRDIFIVACMERGVP